MKKWLCLIASAVLAGPAAAQTDKPAPSKMEAPKPAAEVTSFDFFNGHWGCTGQVLGNDQVPAHPVTATASSGSDLSGFWRQWRYTEHKTNANPMPFAATGMWGYDSAQKKYVSTSADNMGGYGTSTSAGWSADSIAFEGETQMMGHKMNARDTFTKKGAAEFVHVGEFQGPDGNWAKFDEETCKKAKGASKAKPAGEKAPAEPKK